MPWEPGQWKQKLELEEPYEDVPPHLMGPLTAWISEYFDNGHILWMFGIAFRLTIPDPRTSFSALAAAQGPLLLEMRRNATFMLTCIEWLLEKYADQAHVRQLDDILVQGNSVFRIRSDGGGLERRTLPGVKKQVEAVVATAGGSAADHLRDAWNSAYGRVADPGKAYSEAIKAVEAATIPVISPNNHSATLGTVIGQIRSDKSKWSFAIRRQGGDSVEDILSLLSLLWKGQTSRHAGVQPTERETLDAAQAAVHIAATLVQFFVAELFRDRAADISPADGDVS